jgi:tripartite-type tricarboxylate transporter receptor subunit TctC
MTRWIAQTLAIILSTTGGGMVAAQEYPTKPIRIVTQLPGGGADFMARLIGQGLAPALGQPVIIDNRPTGTIQGEVVSRSTPDGHTLYVTGGVFWTYPLLRPTPYDVVRDFSPITQVVKEVSILVIQPSVPAKSVKELIAFAKGKPGELNFGSAGTGGASHLAGELFKAMAGVNIVHVPYKGTGLAVIDLLGGQIQMMINSAPALTPHMKTGKLRALAVTSTEPSALAPELPTLTSSGVPGYEAVGITAMFAPAKTPDAVIRRLNAVVVRYINTPETREKLFNAGGEVVGNSPEQMAAVMKREMTTWAKVIKDAGIRLE